MRHSEHLKYSFLQVRATTVFELLETITC